jgi:predicted nucleic acid-binding protein
LRVTLDSHGEELLSAHLRSGRYHRLQAGEKVLVPAHWPTRSHERSRHGGPPNRIDPDRMTRFTDALASLAIRIEPPHAPAAWNAVIQVATKHRLTIYDAAYLELAQRTGLLLATLDGDLRKAAQAEGAPLVEQA